MWQDGSTADTYLVTASGLNTVTVIDGACQWSDTVSITVNAPPRFDLGPDLTLCVGEDVTLEASVDSEALYLWED